MPPLPGKEFRDQFRGGLDYITGFFKSSEHPEDRDNESHASARSEDMDDNDNVVVQSGASAKKRAREAHEEQSRNTKKQRTFSREEGAYFGQYDKPTPKDATRVMVPTNELLDDDLVTEYVKPAKVTRLSKPLAGGHKTTNTLGRLQPGRNGATSNVHANLKPSSRAAPPRDSTIGDGFNDLASTRATTFKRRATNGASQAPTRKKPIQIIDDSDEVTMGEVEAVNGNRISSDSQNSVIEVGSQSQPKTAWFQPTEMRNVHKHANPPPAKKRRQPSSAQGSTHNGSHTQMRPASRQTNHYGEIDDLNTPKSRITRVMATKGESERKPRVPPIELDRGMGAEEIMREKAVRDLKALNGGMEFKKHHPAHTQTHAQGLQEGRCADKQGIASCAKTRTLAEELGYEHSRKKAHEEEQRLSDKFVRAPYSPPPEEQKRQQNEEQHQQQQQPRQPRARAMQVSSGDGGSNAFEDSPDQLFTASPNFSRKPADGRSSASATRSSPRQPSPSDIMPANLTSRATKSNSVSQPLRRAKKPTNHIDDAPLRIPVSLIYSRGCHLVSKEDQQVELVWRDDEAQFEVERNEHPFRIPGRDEIMSIGHREAKTLHSSKVSTRVVLKGSESAGRSNGCIVLQFPDSASKTDFGAYMIEASKDTITFVGQEAERMDNMFENLAEVVQADAERYAQKIRTDHDATQRHEIMQTARRKENRPSSEERVTYEQPDGGSSNKVSARSRMLGFDATSADQSTKSPFFQDDHRPRKSTRQSKAAVEKSPSPDPITERWTHANPQEEWHQSVMYPATGARRITVDFQDLERLDEGEFLNDNLVGYALRRIEESMAPEHKSKVHFFNSYFFTSLTSKNGRKTFNYESVKKWTKQKDLFDIPYVIVPINENLHWYVAIICNLPNLARKSAALGDHTSEATTPSTSQKASARPSPIRDPVVQDSQDVDDKPDAQAMQSLSIESEKVSQEGSEVFNFGEDGMVVGNGQGAHHEDRPVQAKGGKKSKKRNAPALPKYATDKPIIITLDSFGQAHTGQIASLKDYVAAEAMDKRGMEVGREDMKGMTATGVPLQQNFCDCGLYLVGYVAEFAKDPEGFVNKVLTRQLDGDGEFAAFDPSKKRAEIRANLLRLHEQQDAERLALRKAKKASRNRVPETAVNSSPANRPAKNLSTVEQSTLQPSNESVLCSKKTAEAPPPVGELRPSNASALDAALNVGQKLQHNDASNDDEMESGMPRALTTVGSLQKVRESASPHTNFEDGEMLDNHHDNDDEHRPKGMREVLSPELDGLSSILNAGPLPALPHAHEKSPGSEKPTS